MQLFIEACSAKKSWLALDESARRRYLDQVEPLMQRMLDSGVEIVAWGRNNEELPERAPYDYFGVFIFPNEASVLRYEHAFRDAGWYDYFDQVNIGGTIESYKAVLEKLVDL